MLTFASLSTPFPLKHLRRDAITECQAKSAITHNFRHLLCSTRGKTHVSEGIKNAVGFLNV